MNFIPEIPGMEQADMMPINPMHARNKNNTTLSFAFLRHVYYMLSLKLHINANNIHIIVQFGKFCLRV
jgi:hypothetical protein